MKKLKIVLFIALFFALGCFEETSSVFAQQYMQITTIESVIPGGMGRSRLIITPPSGKAEDKTGLKNFFSLTGINLGNIKNNEQKIVEVLNKYAKEGWRVIATSTGSFAGQDGGGIFITRYLLEKK